MTLNTRSIVLIIAALAIAGIAAFLARSWLSAERPDAASAERPAVVANNDILVAAANLPAGKILVKEDLSWQKWPLETIPATYIRKVKGDEATALLGSVVRTGFRAGEPVSPNRLAKKGDRGYMAAVLTPGMRAISIKVSPITGVSGFIFPGDRVDLLLTLKVTSASGSENRAAQTVLTNVRVLAIDQRTDDQSTAPLVAKTVTVEVTPKQAELVAVARDMGDMSVALRSSGDPTITVAEGEDGMAASMPEKGSSHTWDNEVSGVMRRAGPSNTRATVKVVRGGETSSVSVGSGR